MADVIKERITETLEKNYMPYAMSVIVSRAIPEIDGFKPSHRKLLYTMYKMRLLGGQRTKSANVVGQTMKLNPHGDQAIYATMVRMTRGYDALIHPYVDSKGNFGKSSSRDMKYAAARYTEAKLDSICEEIFKDIDRDVVDFIDNYDGSMKEPTLLPTTFPNVLINANKGIAVGMASSICSYNLHEVCEATLAYMKNPDFKVSDVVKGPDFSTGGFLVYKEKEMEEIYNTGLGSFKLRAKYRYDKPNNLIEIYEIPYTTTVEAIIEKIVEMIKNGRIKEVSDIRDETDLSGLKITLDLKKGTDPDILMSKLYKYTTLEDTFSCNFNILVDGRPVVLGFKGIVREWLRFRMGCIRRKAHYEIGEIKDKLHLLYGLKKVLLDIDKAVRIVRETDHDSEVVPNLMQAFEIESDQANYIADIKLRNLNKEYIIKRVNEIQELEKHKAELEELVNSEEKIQKVIASELKAVAKKYAQPRKTEIITAEDLVKHDEHHEVEDFNLKLFVTDHGYIKKIPLVSLRSANQHKLKDDDWIIQELDGTNKDDLLVFSDRGNCYKTKMYELEDHKASSLGSYLPNIMEFEPDEKPLFVAVTGNYKGWILFAFENGKLAKVPLKSYETKTNRKKLVKAYSAESSLITLLQLEEDEDVVVVRYTDSNDYTAAILNSAVVPEKVTKSTGGVQVLRMKKGSQLLNMLRLPASSEEYAEHFRTDKIPVSGVKLDPIDLLEKKYEEWTTIRK